MNASWTEWLVVIGLWALVIVVPRWMRPQAKPSRVDSGIRVTFLPDEDRPTPRANGSDLEKTD
ncbi:MAG TPA: hypothetical protein PLJ27_19960 [Polyangiaceae bacterium]|nr:hypothetical protein [Polyangiaceae bacterium]HNZ23085.1 hypothetical protein [Polyangiaceae bacterium]HOD21137.1 hypothetical protein [Polyangiaceae bacterium]HOE48906.1 hypothetical protein [Polyangiaceae bacterium]HOH02143.1 hypothetical protein [Polyangiaceae bacterium]